MAKDLLKRSEVRVEDTWNLTDIFENVDAMKKALNESVERFSKIIAKEGKVCESAESLYETLSDFDKEDEIVTKCFQYASRLADEDSGVSAYQALESWVRTLISEVYSKVAFIEPEIIAMSDEKLNSFYEELPKLKFYERVIMVIRRKKAHSLSVAEEKLLAMSMDLRGVFSRNFSMLHDADMKFPEVKDHNGEMIKLSNGRYIHLLEGENREVRENAFRKYYAEYKKYLNTYASNYSGEVKSHIFVSRAKKYKSSLECAVLGNNVPESVYHNLLTAVNNNVEVLHRYIRLRKKMLGLDDLRMYDIFTPVVSGVDREYTYEEGKEMVLEALKPLGEDYLKVVKEAFANRWIDVYENEGKRSGAYSDGIFGVHPYILLNFNGSLDNVFTLIHEMGHAMHSHYSSEKQPYTYHDYVIFVAEVASTVNEILLLEDLLKKTTDKKVRMYLLNQYLDMFRGTLFRQTQFAEFELKTHEMEENGEGLTAENLSELYGQINEKYYGPDMVYDEEISYEWARIPHFYYNFYVYQYATSFSAAVWIAHKILEEGEPMVKKYKEFLSAGCSMDPVDIMKAVGVDMSTAQPFEDAIKVMDGVLDEMESYLK